ncbi:hypothetical protein [Celerinatantimonas diazotrophica]|uniref:Uncharacterized protein n=1 Tax=Celerinatantimonas diazotrophica TaxID=412034 RepID=A0A4R1JLV6_9GAMM|nr:hypothetical protein [Celerinatantimonas diazotrophica]TCK51987.1 hypothetical protein EV690_2084 [Celerinatantimonas diazotrophica]CAG9296312.1 hypothetical protein CEDIAZO_01460 [Celerinatantimonas diazotrophica]
MNNFSTRVQNLDVTNVDRLLELFGIPAESFKDALLAGKQKHDEATEFHPVTTAGARAWQEIVGVFRQLAVEHGQGWEKDQLKGNPVLINSERGMTIVIMGGDNNTGLEREDGIQPSTKNSKGHQSQRLLHGTNLSLFQSIDEEPSSPVPVDSHQTWVFLFYLDKEKQEIRAELSLPSIDVTEFFREGKVKVSDWQERRILPAIPFDGGFDDISTPEFTDDSEFFNAEKI